MDLPTDALALAAFDRVARRIPAYQTLLRESGIDADRIKTIADFRTLPVLEKASTFQRFGIKDLCLDGELGRLGSVLTSSGHSGLFAFGLNGAEAVLGMSAWIDELLDSLFQVKSKPTLLINCLPMGVKVPSVACTLAETSVRPDMAVGLIKSLGAHFSQTILVGEAAFIKLLLEMGQRAGIDWKALQIQVIVGEEPLAETARRYLAALLGHDPKHPERGIIASSMGVAEIGLNLFSEVPPMAPLIALRGLLHTNSDLRRKIFGPSRSVPCLFTYDPRRILVEFDQKDRLILTTLEAHLRIPLIRYATGDRGQFLDLDANLKSPLEAHGIPWDLLMAIPIVVIKGRGEHASAGTAPIFPEAVKEGIYHDSAMAALTTANFRLVSGPTHVRVRVQLSPGVQPSETIRTGFFAAISLYVDAPIEVTCEPYESFRSGMALDYERKFSYLAT